MNDIERTIQQNAAIWRGLEYAAMIVQTVTHMECGVPEAMITTLAEVDLTCNQDKIEPLWDLIRRTARLTPDQINDLAHMEGDWCRLEVKA